MGSFDIREKFIGFVKKASTANEEELNSLRRMLITIVETIGAKNFVTITADILKKEHKEFKEILAETSNVFMDAVTRKASVERESFAKFSKMFIPAISNHIFRETHIFYPAALEFVTDKGQWDEVKKGFGIVQI